MKASFKRFVILLITVFVFGLAVSTGNFILSALLDPSSTPEPPPKPYIPPPPGSTLETIEVLSLKAFKKGVSSYDILIELKNPNSEHGAEELKYDIIFLNGDSEIKKINETSYILPAQQKYIVLTNIEINSVFNKIDLDIKSVTWRKLQEFVTLSLNISDTKLERLPPENNFFARLSAFIKNDSLFGLTDIKVFGILFDSGGEAMEINRTSIQTVLESELREVEMFWPNQIELEEVARFEVYAYSNVMKNDNFVRQFGVDESAQEPGSQYDSSPQNYFQLPELFDKFKGWNPF